MRDLILNNMIEIREEKTGNLRARRPVFQIINFGEGPDVG
jgi:hypothetical protein